MDPPRDIILPLSITFRPRSMSSLCQPAVDPISGNSGGWEINPLGSSNSPRGRNFPTISPWMLSPLSVRFLWPPSIKYSTHAAQSLRRPAWGAPYTLSMASLPLCMNTYSVMWNTNLSTIPRSRFLSTWGSVSRKRIGYPRTMNLLPRVLVGFRKTQIVPQVNHHCVCQRFFSDV